MRFYMLIVPIISQLFISCGSDQGTGSSAVSGQTPPAISWAKAPPTDGCTGLASCSPPAGTVFTFTDPKIVGMAACTVSKTNVLVSGNNFVVILRANCLGSQALYSAKVSGTGDVLTSPTLISKACDERTNSVDKFASDIGITSILVAYSCNASTTSTNKNVHLAVLDANGGLVSNRNNVRTTVTSSFKVSWHSSTSQFALAYADLLQRYSSTGASIGGAALLTQNNYSGEDIFDLRVSSSSWQVIKGTTYGASNCSKINTNGVLTCTNQQLNTYSTARAQDILVSSSYSGIAHTVFSPDTCTDSSITYVGPSNELNLSSVLGSISLAGGYNATLIQTSKLTLAITIFLNKATNIVVTNPVANVSSSVDAQIGVGGDGMMFVSWVDGNVLKVVRSVEGVN